MGKRSKKEATKRLIRWVWGMVGVLLLGGLSVSADERSARTLIEILPPNPTSQDEISIRLSGVGSSSCHPRNPQVSILESEIRVDSVDPHEVCTTDVSPWSLTVSLGQLSARTYQAIATYALGGRQPWEIARKAFTVLQGPQALKDSLLQVRQVVGGLSAPTTMAFIGPDDLLVLQKDDGRVRRVLQGALQPGQVLDVAVDNASERGLLGIALHPGFPATPWVYLYYTESSTGSDTSGSPPPLGNRVYRFTWDGHALVNPTRILDLPATPGPNHDGGIIAFGPDGKLYGVIGDLNRDGQLQNFPAGPFPDDTSVVFRLNDDGTIPTDNPFFAQGGNLAKYFAYGIRNSFGISFDPVTGKLWITENGPDTYDEINRVEAGFNGGWEPILGPNARDPQGIEDLFFVPGAQYVDPEFSWRDVVAPTSIVFLDSVQLGNQYYRDLLVGDFNRGTLYRFELNPARDRFDFKHPGLADRVADSRDELKELVLGTGFGGITDLKVGPDGLLYILSVTEGKIFVVSRSSVGPDLTGSWKMLSRDCRETRAGIKCRIRGAFLVQNQGMVKASASRLRFYQSNDTTLDAEDRLLQQVAVGPLRPGQTRQRSWSVTLQGDLGGSFVLAVVDAADTVAEIDETNNVIVFER